MILASPCTRATALLAVTLVRHNGTYSEVSLSVLSVHNRVFTEPLLDETESPRWSWAVAFFSVEQLCLGHAYGFCQLDLCHPSCESLPLYIRSVPARITGCQALT